MSNEIKAEVLQFLFQYVSGIYRGNGMLTFANLYDNFTFVNK
jgi:hypothetical protein